jgi:hypothetical protein
LEKIQLDPKVGLRIRKKISSKPSLVPLNDMKILPIRKKKKEAQVADLGILAKIIPIVATYAFLIKKGILAK